MFNEMMNGALNHNSISFPNDSTDILRKSPFSEFSYSPLDTYRIGINI